MQFEVSLDIIQLSIIVAVSLYIIIGTTKKLARLKTELLDTKLKLNASHKEKLQTQLVCKQEILGILEEYKSKSKETELYINTLEAFVRQHSGYVPPALLTKHNMKDMK